MSKLKNLNELLEEDFNEGLNHGDSRHGNINRNGYFYHVTQQCWNHRNYYSFDAARYRDSLVKSVCKSHNVHLVMNVIMPNHSHEVFYSPDFSNIQTVQVIINSKIARFIANERKEVFSKDTPKVFQNRPTYTIIENRYQLFYLIYYLYHNGDFLKESNKQIPYSCFEYWQQNNFKGYRIDFLEKILEMNIQEILNYCDQQTKEEYQKLNKTLFGRFISSDSRQFIKN